MDEKESILSEGSPESGMRKHMRGTLRCLLVALVAFGLGALIIAFALYVPTRQKLYKANADLELANVSITEKTDQITTLQTDNKTLQTNLDSVTLRMVLLEALSGARGASLAVAVDDYAGARLSLIQASEALDTLSALLGTDQKDVLTTMQQSAAQALTDVKTDLKSVQPELDLLIKNLVLLEDILFPNP